jgi:inner membrane protein
MMAHSHISFGASCWWVYALSKGYPITGVDTLAAMVGALLPDLDHPQSALGRRIPLISYPLSSLVGHRGVTHSLLATLALLLLLGYLTALPAYSVFTWAIVPVCIGYLSHIAGDALTPSGVPLFWPLKRTYSLKLFKTRSPLETVVVGAITLAVFLLGGVKEQLLANVRTTLNFLHFSAY